MVHVLFMVVLVVVLPVMAVRQLPLLRQEVVPRVPAYMSSAVLILGLGATSLGLGLWRFGAEGMGLVWPGSLAVLRWVAILLGVAAVLLVGSQWLQGALGTTESPILRGLLPRSRREKTVFAGLSFCAGTGEELAYRAYATSLLLVLTGSPVFSVLVANEPFAVVHVYQGAVGMVRTYLLGVALGVSFIATASVWPAMVAHTLIDLIGGLVIGDRFLDAQDTPVPA